MTRAGGRMWPYLFNRICVCLLVMQLFTCCVFLVKGAYVQAFVLVAAMPLLTLRFWRNASQVRGLAGVPVRLSHRRRAPEAACAYRWPFDKHNSSGQPRAPSCRALLLPHLATLSFTPPPPHRAVNGAPTA